MKILKFKYIQILLFLSVMSSCTDDFVSVLPDDRIVQENFWQNEDDAVMALYGIYNVLQDRYIYGYGGGEDAMSPNAFQWAHWEGKHMQVGNGTIQPSDGGIVAGRWTDAYRGINRVNSFLANIDRVDMDVKDKETMKGEAYFLRGVFYSLLVNTYGGVPLILEPISVEEARTLSRSTKEESWNQVHSDYDMAISLLPTNAEVKGRATLGAALGMKMRAFLYQSEWEQVIEYADKVIALGEYDLFPSYEGLFHLDNENNEEVIFDVQFMDGPFSQGSIFDRYWQPQNLENGVSGSNSVAPIQDLVDAYETIDGTNINPDKPFENRDPRLDFTILRPGAYFQDQLYPDEIQNHTGQKVGYGIRKYTIEDKQIVPTQSPLNFIVLRYADILLSKAEALIEGEEKNIPKAIELINRIRTERNDVNMYSLNANLDFTEARELLRHERRIEFALEGLYWSDIKRWEIGNKIYPLEVRGGSNELIEVKFEDGYNLEEDQYLPLPDSELSLNPNLEQNPGY
ncbi:RagB/SusD family nutrient uptake outer membrane protein [Salegentibacter sp. BLCTC]|uniref:RagB/SusD family nutrient uptake outer membrane protein n=1 Tax=Salegentibacter sp. BLCTC TaxID=2697368 RepID=UPI00187B230E|nr:RagB/SusD family nutrient uptake outer membrane protein [Salegentibacter sp. BLCTC]MBE7641069.1 RagB/SusD family nutrient uptake outer membrane protein [Salegentibacter sp. BLCTC]